MDDPISVLSIDGGGMRGIIPALVLRRLEQEIAQRLKERGLAPQPLINFFDVVAGTR